ncbi:vWA domain-containing protein [Rubinisphaera margarita]|uniref:vWA domain-containing protein n=1 Tax=Rubinisphaera margarita TaxID=2909586 RepID=UPI001EE8EF37|nr:VWA domain-containing protein [Rubinisphaera margarita]MCG6158117.1 VWA domain-containing protein [Rubinisphaera margarita]
MARHVFLSATSLCLAAMLVGCGQETREAARYVGTAHEFGIELRPSAVSEHPLPEHNTETYDHIVENPFLDTKSNPLSTFSIDVDTASYANTRRMLNDGQLPLPGAVRLEEFVNYFDYSDPQPEGDGTPFSVNVEVASCPWAEGHQLVRIGLKGREFEQDEEPPCNLVFLLDVSGSMQNWNKLPLVKSAMRMLVEELDHNDRVAIAVYASASGLVLPSTPCDQKAAIMTALDSLSAGGSTNGGEGIHLAYNVAQEQFLPEGVNRVILCTDGDFNVGTTNQSELIRLIENKARTGVFLSVLGFGTGNYKDSTMEKLADRGNGNYGYIDTMREARKMLVEQLTGTLVTIAKDVKIQVDFNPAHVQAYRLLGYENRMLRAEDFQDDTKDAGEIGAGHTVTALYELIPTGTKSPMTSVQPSKYQTERDLSEAAHSDELLTVRLRYKLPDAEESQPLNVAVDQSDTPFEQASCDFQFAASVASFGMLLRDSEHKGTATYEDIHNIAEQNLGPDSHGFRSEFLNLVARAEQLAR